MVSALAPHVSKAAEIILKPGTVPVGTVFSQRDLQARHSQQLSLAAPPAQGHAIAGVQPAGVAAGTIAMVSTKAGDDAIAALGLNQRFFSKVMKLVESLHNTHAFRI